MNLSFTIASVLLLLFAFAHSYLGERYIHIPLLKRGHLPKIFGSDLLTARTLRFAWHLTTLAWIGIAVILLVLDTSPMHTLIARIIIGISLTSAILAGTLSRGRHFSWIVFLTIALVVWFGI
jgi:hypothetical protein